jgi:hypothetical protein
LKKCEHLNFEAAVTVNRVLNPKRPDDAPRFMADVTIRCADCELPFRFLGMRPGMHWEVPMTSVDFGTARLPIAPGVSIFSEVP